MSKKSKLPGAEIRHGGRTVKLTVFMNTDEPTQVVFERVQKVVKSAPGAPMCLILVSQLKDEKTTPFWEEAFQKLEQEAERRGPTRN